MLHGQQALAGEIHILSVFQRYHEPRAALHAFHNIPISQLIRHERGRSYAISYGTGASFPPLSLRRTSVAAQYRSRPQARRSIHTTRRLTQQPLGTRNNARGGGLLRGSGSGKVDWASNTPTYADAQAEAKLAAKKREEAAELKRIEAARKQQEEQRKRKEQEERELQQRLVEAQEWTTQILLKGYNWDVAVLAASQAPIRIRELVLEGLSDAWEERYENEVRKPIANIEERLHSIRSYLQTEQLLNKAGIHLALRQARQDALERLLDRSMQRITAIEHQSAKIEETMYAWWSSNITVANWLQAENEDKKRKGGSDDDFNSRLLEYSDAARDTYLCMDDLLYNISGNLRRIRQERKQKKLRRETSSYPFSGTSKQRRAFLKMMYLCSNWVLESKVMSRIGHSIRRDNLIAACAAHIPHVFKCQTAGYRYEETFFKLRDNANVMMETILGYELTMRLCNIAGLRPDYNRNRLDKVRRLVDAHEASIKAFVGDFANVSGMGFDSASLKHVNAWDTAQIRRWRPFAGLMYDSVLQDLGTVETVLQNQVEVSAGTNNPDDFRKTLAGYEYSIKGYTEDRRHVMKALFDAQLWTGVADAVLGLQSLTRPDSPRVPGSQTVQPTATASRGGAMSYSAYLDAKTSGGEASLPTEPCIKIEYLNSEVGMFYACEELARSDVLAVKVITSKWNRGLAAQFVVVTNGVKVSIFELNGSTPSYPARGRGYGQLEPALSALLGDESIRKVSDDVDTLRQHLLISYACELNNAVSVGERNNKTPVVKASSGTSQSRTTGGELQTASARSPSYQDISNLLKHPRYELMEAFEAAARGVLNTLEQYRALANPGISHSGTPEFESRHPATEALRDNGSTGLESEPRLGPLHIDRYYGSGPVLKMTSKWRLQVPATRGILVDRLSASWAENLLKSRKNFRLTRSTQGLAERRRYTQALRAYCLIVKFEEDLTEVERILGGLPKYDTIVSIAEKAKLPLDEAQLAAYLHGPNLRGDKVMRKTDSPSRKAKNVPEEQATGEQPAQEKSTAEPEETSWLARAARFLTKSRSPSNSQLSAVEQKPPSKDLETSFVPLVHADADALGAKRVPSSDSAASVPSSKRSKRRARDRQAPSPRALLRPSPPSRETAKEETSSQTRTRKRRGQRARAALRAAATARDSPPGALTREDQGSDSPVIRKAPSEKRRRRRSKTSSSTSSGS